MLLNNTFERDGNALMTRVCAGCQIMTQINSSKPTTYFFFFVHDSSIVKKNDLRAYATLVILFHPGKTLFFALYIMGNVLFFRELICVANLRSNFFFFFCCLGIYKYIIQHYKDNAVLGDSFYDYYTEINQVLQRFFFFFCTRLVITDRWLSQCEK